MYCVQFYLKGENVFVTHCGICQYFCIRMNCLTIKQLRCKIGSKVTNFSFCVIKEGFDKSLRDSKQSAFIGISNCHKNSLHYRDNKYTSMNYSQNP